MKLSKVQKDMELQKKHTEEERELGPTPDMYPYYVISLIKNLPNMKKQHRRKNRRML